MPTPVTLWPSSYQRHNQRSPVPVWTAHTCPASSLGPGGHVRNTSVIQAPLPPSGPPAAGCPCSIRGLDLRPRPQLRHGSTRLRARAYCRWDGRPSRPVRQPQARRDDILCRCVTRILRIGQSPHWTWQHPAGGPVGPFAANIRVGCASIVTIARVCEVHMRTALRRGTRDGSGSGWTEVQAGYNLA